MNHIFYKDPMHKGEYTLETSQVMPLLFEWMLKKPFNWLGGLDTKGALWHFICEKDGLDSYMDDKPQHDLYMQVRYTMSEYEITLMRLRKLFLSRFDKESFDNLGMWQTDVKRNMRDDMSIGKLLKRLLTACGDNKNLMEVELGEPIMEQLNYLNTIKEGVKHEA